MEAACSSETLVPTYQTIRCHNPGDHNMNLHYPGNNRCSEWMLLVRHRYRWEAGNIRIDSVKMFCKGVELLREAPMAGCREVEQAGFQSLLCAIVPRRDKAPNHALWRRAIGPRGRALFCLQVSVACMLYFTSAVGRKVMLLEVISMIAKLLKVGCYFVWVWTLVSH
jgi:hypothetical protein